MKRAFRTFLVSLGLAVLVVPLGAALVAAEDSSSVLRVAVPARPPGLGNPYSSLPVGAINSNYVLFDALTLIGDKGAVLPALALSWRPEGESAWLFELRPDVVFSNGEPLTAQSVVDVLTFLRSPEAGGYLVSGETQMIESAEVVDDLTVRINTNRPDAILPKRMSFVFMIPMTYWNEVGSDGFSLKPIGSGPFKLKDWGQTTGRFVFERNDLSWRKAADFDEISFTAVGDVVSRAQSMLSDQIDLSFKLSLDLLTDLNAAGFKTLARETYSIGAWAFHQVDKTSPISDIRVRRALNMAVDRDAIAKSVLSGVTAPVSQVATSEVF
ncbi:MAG: ABC transporter substrate-binding protein, partial [Rhodospirillaceae bacterium]